MSKALDKRIERLMPKGVPKWIRCYDNGGETCDRYTVVYTGNYAGRNGRCEYVSMTGSPYHPQGVCSHGEHTRVIDYPTYGHLGKKIKFVDLPEDCRKVVLHDYKQLWELNYIFGFYNEQGYRLFENGNDEPIYEAGNSPCESTTTVAEGVGVKQLRAWCVQTGKEMAKERGMAWEGCSREDNE
jgi:hypothetical protein